MNVTQKMKEAAMDVAESVRDAVEELRTEVDQLKNRVGRLVKRDGREVPVHVRRGARMPMRWADDAWLGLSWRELGWPGLSWPAPLLDWMWDLPSPDPFGAVWARTDVGETDDEVRVSMELPGVDPDDIDVRLDGRVLTVTGEKRSEEESRSRGWYRHERRYGAFRRSITLPVAPGPDGVEARFDRGVLTVTLPKEASSRGKVKRIPIRASSS